MRFSSLPCFSLARAAALAAALACSSATSFGGNLYTENFNSYTGFQNANPQPSPSKFAGQNGRSNKSQSSKLARHLGE